MFRKMYITHMKIRRKLHDLSSRLPRTKMKNYRNVRHLLRVKSCINSTRYKFIHFSITTVFLHPFTLQKF